MGKISVEPVCFAFNQNGVMIEGYEGHVAEITIGGRTITASVFDDVQRVEVGGLLSILFPAVGFDTPRSVVADISVSIKDNEGHPVYDISGTILVIWGSVCYVEEGGGIYRGSERYVRWFTAFPFTVSTLTPLGIQETEPEESEMSVVGIPFPEGEALGLPVSAIQRIHLKKDSSTDGIYLRWIDRYGFIQYFLFSKGKYVTKPKNGDSVSRRKKVGSVEIESSLVRNKDVDKTVSCEAAFLSDDELAYVCTIADSVMVEMYHRNGIWEPVSVEAEISRDGRKSMHRMTVKIQRKGYKSQVL